MLVKIDKGIIFVLVLLFLIGIYCTISPFLVDDVDVCKPKIKETPTIIIKQNNTIDVIVGYDNDNNVISVKVGDNEVELRKRKQ